MVDYAVMPVTDYEDACDAIREKDGSTAVIKSGEMGDKIRAIETGVTPEITVSSAGLITATSGSKSATKQLSTQAAATITPGTENKTAVSSGKYTTGAVTVKGDANLKAENVASGVSIFGVTGTAKIATAFHEQITLSGAKVFYYTLDDVTGMFGAIKGATTTQTGYVGYMIDTVGVMNRTSTSNGSYDLTATIDNAAKSVTLKAGNASGILSKANGEFLMIYDTTKTSIANA